MLCPLTDLTKKNAPNRVKWTEECEKSFKILKNKLCTEPILRSPDFSEEFILQTDASERGIGAVLSQYDQEGSCDIGIVREELPIISCETEESSNPFLGGGGREVAYGLHLCLLRTYFTVSDDMS